MGFPDRHTGTWEKVTIRFSEEPPADLPGILMAELDILGYEGFLEKDNEIITWIPGNLYRTEHWVHLKEKYHSFCTFDILHLPESSQNWNRIWEENYQPVMIDEQCRIRASFHPADPTIPFDLVINPGMAFGTGHHESTHLMLKWMLRQSFTGKHVLDMGCGTGILSVLAAKKGAAKVVAVDNFPNAVKVTKENASLNSCAQISVIEGDHTRIPGLVFDIILVNITRNIIIEIIPTLVKHLANDGIMLLSGFFYDDRITVIRAAEENGLVSPGYIRKNEWVAIELTQS